jgi:hypothetical protein
LQGPGERLGIECRTEGSRGRPEDATRGNDPEGSTALSWAIE